MTVTLNDLACGHGLFLGLADGSRTVYPTGTKTGRAPQLYRTGSWDGQQRLYATARTNQCPNSEQINLWSVDKSGGGVLPVVTPNYSLSPRGDLTADRVVLDKGTGVGQSRVGTNATTTAVTTTQSVWLKTNDGSTVKVAVRLASTVVAVNVTPVWQRFSVTGPGGAGTTFNSVMLWDAQTTSNTADLSMWGNQCEPGSIPTGYIPTVASPVTVTDYALSADKTQATLASAPAAGTMVYRRTMDEHGVLV